MLAFVKTEWGFAVRGDIAEGADFSPLPEGRVELDLSEVRRINSTGVRSWLRWMEGHQAPVVLSNVPCSVVVELSLVRGLSRDVIVKSAWAPYYNPKTDRTTRILLDASALRQVQSTRKIPDLTCRETGAKLEFDEDERNYFAFLFAGARVAADA